MKTYNTLAVAKPIALLLLVAYAAPTASAARCGRGGCSGFDLLDNFRGGWDLDFHADMIGQIGRQFRCAQICANRNRLIRYSHLSNADVTVDSGAKDGDDVPCFQVAVTLPGVTMDNVKVQATGDILTISAERTRTKEQIPDMTEEARSCNCQDVAESYVGKKERFSRQLRLPQSAARDGLHAELSKDGELVVTIPKLQPETFNIEIKPGPDKPAIAPDADAKVVPDLTDGEIHVSDVPNEL